MEEILERLVAIETKLDALLYYLSEEMEDEIPGDQHGLERDQNQAL